MKTKRANIYSKFENWGISFGADSRIVPSFGWGMLGHVTRLGQSRARKNICWIFTGDITVGRQVSFENLHFSA